MLYRGSNCSLSLVMDGRIMRYGIISSYQPAVTYKIVKCSSARVPQCSSAKTNYQTSPSLLHGSGAFAGRGGADLGHGENAGRINTHEVNCENVVNSAN